MLTNVMPQRATFFLMLTSHTERLVGGANATMRLVSGLGNPSSEALESLIEEVNINEASADEIKQAFIRMLYESFTTPVNREQLHTLILDLDRVLDTLQSVANAVRMYRIESSTPQAREMASLASDACLRLNRAVTALGDRKRTTEVIAHCREIELLEARRIGHARGGHAAVRARRRRGRRLAGAEDAALLLLAGSRARRLQARRAHAGGNPDRERLT